MQAPEIIGTVPRSRVASTFRIARHPDDPFFDRCKIVQVPRWKESDLSGDEWRFSYAIRLSRKGKVIARRICGNLEFAAIEMARGLAMGFGELETERGWECVSWDEVPDDGFCCQPGCREPSAFVGLLKREVSKDGCFDKPNNLSIAREFCLRHTSRGDCSRDDADSNYTWFQIAEDEVTT